MTEIRYELCDDCIQEFPIDGIFEVYSSWDDCFKHFCRECYFQINDFAFV